MKRLVIAILLFLPLLFAVPCRAAAPTIANSGAQHISCFVSNATTLSCSLPNNVTAGNMIVVFVGATQSGVTTVNTPTMTGETFVKSTGASNGGSVNQGQVATYTDNSAAGGQKQVTVTTTGTTGDIHIHIIEVTGQAASPIDATGNTSSTTLSVSTSGATTNATDLVLAFFFDLANNHTLTPTAPYTQVEQSNNVANGDVALSEQNTTSSTGVQTAAATGNSGDGSQQGIMAIQPPAGGGGSGTKVLGQSTIVGSTKVM